MYTYMCVKELALNDLSISHKALSKQASNLSFDPMLTKIFIVNLVNKLPICTGMTDGSTFVQVFDRDY